MAPSSAKCSVIIIDDEVAIRKTVYHLFKSKCNCEVLDFADGREAYPYLERGDVAAVYLDWLMPYPGEKVLEHIATNHPDVRVVIMTALHEIDVAVHAMKLGASDFITKPINDAARLVATVKEAINLYEYRLQNENLRLQLLHGDTGSTPAAFSNIITRSESMRGIFRYIQGISGSLNPVLITGETGVGKELLAKAIHDVSRISDGPFVAVNIAGLDDHMFSDTLFGHRKGAFTGADASRDGLIVAAKNGTLFLDEIGDLSPESQVKLLRLLQEGEYYRLGSDALLKSNARIIAATNKNIAAKGYGNFRKDLYYRLTSHQFSVPPLREREGDVGLLVQHFISESAAELKKPVPAITPEVITALEAYHWPGNIRELKNVVHDLVSINRNGTIAVKDLPPHLESLARVIPAFETEKAQEHPLSSIFGTFPSMEQMEEYLIKEAMSLCGGNLSTAGKLLGVNRTTIRRRLDSK